MATVHLTWWWLWYGLAGFAYIAGFVLGMILTIVADEAPRWWVRPSVLVWPLTLTILGIWHAARFLIGRE